jgi:hypothetical protein
MVVNWRKKPASLFAPERARDTYGHWLYVQCDRCGEKIRTRVDLRNDLSVRYGKTDRDTTRFCRKTVVGSGRCFQEIEVELTFDAHRQLIDRHIQGGNFISEEEYFDRARA